MAEPKYVNKFIINIKKLIDSDTIIVGDFNTPLTAMDRSSNQKINKETMTLNDTLDQMDLTNIFRTLHPKAAEYTFFSSTHGMFSRIDHILGHKSALSKHKKIEIIACIFSDHNTTKLEINHKKRFGKLTNTWRLKNILLKNEWANQEVKEEIKKYMKINENVSTTTQKLWDAAKAVIRGKHIAIQAFLKKEERSQIHNLTLHLKELEKEHQIKPQTSRRQGIIKIRAEINAIKTKQIVEQINEIRSWFFERINKISQYPSPPLPVLPAPINPQFVLSF